MSLHAARLQNPSLSAVDRPLILYFALCALLLGDTFRVVAGVAAQTPYEIVSIRVDMAVALAAALILAALGVLAARRREAVGGVAFAIGAMVGVIFFARTLGSALADPREIGWLMTTDWAQHYSGWAMFRSTPWSWPPGLMPEVWYPVGTSIVYTDSLPLLALLLKPLSGLLPQRFQYIGLWLAASCVLQGGFGALLVSRAARTPATVLAGAALFVFAPVLIQRIHHDTLTAHWLLLAAFWLYFRAPPKHPSSEAWPWWMLTAIASLVHPYLAAMVFAIEFAYAWKRSRDDVALPMPATLGLLGVSLAICATAWWLCGAVTIRAADSSGGVAYGVYSLNLLAFFNPMNYSGLLPNLPARMEQYEGFAYLGAGMLALLALVVADRIRGTHLTERPRDWAPLAIVAILLVAFAVSTVVSIGLWTPIDFPLRSRWLGMFRSSGRFVWVAYYALMLLALGHALRRLAPLRAAALLAAVLIVQMIDLSAVHGRVAQLRLKADAPTLRVDNPGWDSLVAGRHHLTLLPPPACGRVGAPYLPMLLFAAEHALTVNTGYLARWNARATGRYCETLHSELQSGQWSRDDVYILGRDWKARFAASAPTARCERLDGYDVCIVEDATSQRVPQDGN